MQTKPPRLNITGVIRSLSNHTDRLGNQITGAIGQVGYLARRVAGPVMSRVDFLVPARWVLRLMSRQDPLLFSALRRKSRK